MSVHFLIAEKEKLSELLRLENVHIPAFSVFVRLVYLRNKRWDAWISWSVLSQIHRFDGKPLELRGDVSMWRKGHCKPKA